MNDKPHFRFNPGAYERDAFESSQDACGACGRPCVWKFKGIVYTAGPKPVVCARCVADGSVAKVADDYGLHDADFDEDVDPVLAEEVEKRTPGFSTFNAFVWPVRDKAPLAFVGYGDDEALKAKPAVIAAMETLAEELGDEDIAGGYALIFKHLDREDYVAVLDLD
jgi:uncharacterized protein CbrC (UPF0167 family)